MVVGESLRELCGKISQEEDPKALAELLSQLRTLLAAQREESQQRMASLANFLQGSTKPQDGAL